MAKMPRGEIFSPDEIACVHVMNRAVRRCFLMGEDPVTGKNYDHRKGWMQRRLELHAACFGIDLLGELGGVGWNWWGTLEACFITWLEDLRKLP